MLHTSPTRIATPVHEFHQVFSFSRRGARLARLMGAQRLADWGWPYDSEVNHTTALVIGELTANAALHGQPSHKHVPSAGFRLRLMLGPGLILPTTIRIEVTDEAPDRHPDPSSDVTIASPEHGTGRGLVLVEAVASRWGITDAYAQSKTIWAELDLTTD